MNISELANNLKIEICSKRYYGRLCIYNTYIDWSDNSLDGGWFILFVHGTKKWLNGNPDRAGREFWQRRVRGADDPEGAREPEPQGPVAVGLHQDTPGRNQRRAFYVFTLIGSFYNFHLEP